MVGATKLASGVMQASMLVFGLWSMSNLGKMMMGTSWVHERRAANQAKSTEKAYIEHAEKTFWAEEVACELHLFCLEAARHCVVLLAALWLGDSVVRGQQLEFISPQVMHFCKMYACCQAALFFGVWAIGHSPLGVRSTVERRH